MAYVTIPAAYSGGHLNPLSATMHSAECPLLPGYAQSIARNVFATGGYESSATGMVDPVDVVRMLPDDTVAWHVGNGNPYSLGWEQAGYAAFTRDTWLSDLGMAQMRLLAAEFRKASDAYGIPKRWGTWQEARDCAARGQKFGYITHDDNRLAFGGTDHTDPMPDYPKDVFINLVNEGSAPVTEEEIDMLIIYAAGEFPAIWGPNYFTALSPEEIKNFTNAGIKSVWVRPEVYAGMASGINR